MCGICSIRNDSVSKTEIRVAGDYYTDMFAEWKKGVLTLCAYGEGEAYYRPNFCPECGRKVKE